MKAHRAIETGAKKRGHQGPFLLNASGCSEHGVAVGRLLWRVLAAVPGAVPLPGTAAA